MAASAEWIRKNMLFPDDDRKKQLAEGELKFQQSFQKLSIPDWYLDKRSNPPNILKVMPIEYRPPLWKNSTPKGNCKSNSTSSDSTDKFSHAKENVNEKTKKVAPLITSFKNKICCQQMSPETKHTRSPTKSSSPKEEILDVNIPIKKFPRIISKTFPKVSPSRKIQNINLVFPPGPKIEFSKDFEDMSTNDYNDNNNKETFVLKERQFNVDRTAKTEDLKNVDVRIDKRENKQKSDSFQFSQAVTIPLKTLEKLNFFKIRANSTPKSSKASEVLTTPLKTPDAKPNFFKCHANSISKFFRASEVVTTPLNVPYVKPIFKCRPDYTSKFSRAVEVVPDPINVPDVKPSFKCCANYTSKFSQASEVVTTPLNVPDIKPIFKCRPDYTSKFYRAVEVVPDLLNVPDVKPSFKCCANYTSKSSQASEAVTTPLNVPDVKPKFELRANSTPKFSRTSEAVTTPLNVPDVKPKFFKLRANSTPKFSQASEVVTSPLNTPDVKPKFSELHANSTPKFSRASEAVTSPLNTPDVKPKFFTLRANSTPKFSPAQLFSSTIIEENQKKKILSSTILEKSLIFENKSTNESNKSENIRRSKKMSPNLLEKTFIFEKSSTHNSFLDLSKSIDSELPVRDKQLKHEKNVVREIVRNLNEKARKSLQPRHDQDADRKRFVKQIVNALERGDISRMRILSSRSSINDEISFSESESKSHITSDSPKDTDYSDYGQRSLPVNNNCNDQTFNLEHFKEDTLKVKEKGAADDSVYWISVPRCTLPRSSSLLSMISRLSSHGHSPCISPIKSPSEVEFSLKTSWGAIYKTKNALSKKLFHETAVIDSGYSD